MISTALFLTAGLMASPVIIQDVKASREAGHLRVEVAGDGGIDPDGVRTRLDNGILLIYLTDTRVREDNRAWDLADGAGQIKAHRHKFETELVVPLAGNGCTGPVELQGSDNGITALVGCDGTVAAKSAVTAAASVDAKTRTKSRRSEEQLKELVELPSEPAAAVVAKAASAPEILVEAKVPEAKAAPEIKTTVKTKTEAKPAVEPTKAEARTDVLVPEAVTTGSAGTTGTAPSGGMRSIGVPAAFLAILAVGAYLFARRRRTISVRHIQILETASLGPKRSLVVARVGNETLILGTSEAGITLLKGGAGEPAGAVATTAPSLPELETAIAASAKAKAAKAAIEAAEAEAAAFEISQPLEEALADIPEPGTDAGNDVRATARGGFRTIEGGLASLFNGRPVDDAKDAHGDDNDIFPFETRPPARRNARPEQRLGLKDRLRASDRDREDSFENLLEDSVEDQELRQKLAAGMSARVR